MKKKLLYGQVGASLGAFIGSVHRVAASFDGLASLAAGCFSRGETVHGGIHYINVFNRLNIRC